MQTTAKAHDMKHATARAILAASIAVMPLALAACGGQVGSSELEEVEMHVPKGILLRIIRLPNIETLLSTIQVLRSHNKIS